ncbi:MAG: hypothetical protein ABJF01_03030 [bacterium]
MKLFRRSSLLLAMLVSGACERAKAPARADSPAAPKIVAAPDSSTTPPRNWDASAGPVLLIAAEAPTHAFVLLPDSANSASQIAGLPQPASVTLFGRSGTVQTAELPGVSDSGSCVVATLSAAPPPRPWSVGFIGGVVSPLTMDSTESIARSDSLALVTGATRLASALPNDSAGRFAGLPFVVHGLWRFTIPSGPQVVIATLVRQINQEATPLQERTLLFAERVASDTTLSTVYSERSSGDEETIETRDILAAALLGATKTPAVVLSRDFGDSIAYALIERGADGRWRARWTSARRRC